MEPIPPDRTGDVSAAGTISAAWGIAGFILILLRGAWRLAPRAFDLFDLPLETVHWIAAGASVIAFGVGEGYVAIQRHYIPRLLARADRLRRNPSVLFGVLAPLYCMGLVGWDTRTTVRGWGMVVAIVLMIVGMTYVPTPWREIVLVGVVLALVWAAVACTAAGILFFRRPHGG